MKRYPEYKESDAEFIKVVPSHWQMKRLKHVTESIKNGTTAPQIQSGETDYLVTRIETISTGEINFDKVGHVNYWDGIETYRLRLGDILLSHINSLAILGNCAMFENSACLYHGMNLLRIRPNKLVDDRFLLYWLKSYPTNQLIKSFAKFAIGQVSISITNLKEIPITYPPLIEQTQIVNFLDRKTRQIDELIRIKERRIELLHEQRTALINQAVTKGLDPNVEMKPLEVEWIGKIPRHWTMERLKHVTESIKNGTTAPQIQSGQTDYPVTRIETISTGEINFDKVGHVNYWAGIETYRLRLGDILLSHINSLAILGNCAMLENSASLYHGMNLLRIRPNNLTDDRFLLYWLKSYPTNQLIKSFAKFAIGQVSISITNLKEIPISYPLLSEQTQIANFLDHKTKQIDELIAAEQRKIKLLKEYRQSLISEAVTGKIDVRNEV